MNTNIPDIMILGIGCTLYSDEGFGVKVVKKLKGLYEFPDNVSMSIELTPATAAKVDDVIGMVLKELDRLGVHYKKGLKKDVSCDPI